MKQTYKTIRRIIKPQLSVLAHDYQVAVKAAEDFGIETLIFSGRIKGQLKRALIGEYIASSTRIVSDEN